MSMSDDLLREVLDRLDEFKFKPRQGWLRQGVCPSCKQKELYTHADSPWVLKCGRLNNCGYEAHIKDLYPDLFDHWSKRYQAEPTKNPNAAADAYLSMAQNGGFVKDMTAGKGYIALAALIFAKWKPVNAMFACLLFGFLDALSIRLQGTPLPLVGKVPVQFMQALPYVLTVVLLAGFIGKAIPPKAGGVPYVKER